MIIDQSTLRNSFSQKVLTLFRRAIDEIFKFWLGSSSGFILPTQYYIIIHYG